MLFSRLYPPTSLLLPTEEPIQTSPPLQGHPFPHKPKGTRSALPKLPVTGLVATEPQLSVYVSVSSAELQVPEGGPGLTFPRPAQGLAHSRPQLVWGEGREG